MSVTMTAAQLAQQNNRTDDGRYAEMLRDETDLEGTDAVDEPAPALDPTEPVPVGQLVRDADTLYIDDAQLAHARHELEVLNSRLARAGGEESFSLSVTPMLVLTGEGEVMATNRVELERPVIQVGDWRLAGIVTAANDDPDAPAITQPVPGAEQLLGKWRATDAQRCDHCGRRQYRGKTYVLVDADGNHTQVGSTCVGPFTGISGIRNLAALDRSMVDLLDLDELENDGFGVGERGSGKPMRSVRDSIALALALSDSGRTFTSRNAAMYDGGTSTCDQLRGLKGSETDILDRAAEDTDSGLVDDVLAAAQAATGEGPYVENLKTLTRQKYVSDQHLGTVVSAISVWRRAQEAKAQKASVAKGFIADVGASLKGQRVAAKVVKVIGTSSYINGYERYGTMLIMQTPDGHLIKWNSSGERDEEIGDEVVIVGGRVKAHGEYKGDDQTVLTRAKLEPVTV